MSTTIEIKIKDDGTFAIDAEPGDDQEEASEPTGNETIVKTKAQVLKAVSQLIDAAQSAGGNQVPDGGSTPPDDGSDAGAAPDDEESAMMGAYKGR